MQNEKGMAMKPSPDSLQKAHFGGSASNYDQSHAGDEHTIAGDLVLKIAQVQSYDSRLGIALRLHQIARL